MGRALDELIELLLEEIALGGETGLAFADLATIVQHFYQSPITLDNNLSDQNDTESSNLPITISVDRLFLSKVWKWLARHPDVSIGKEGQHNDKSLDDLEELYPGYTAWPVSDTSNGHLLARSVDEDRQSNEVSVLASDPHPRQKSTAPHLYVNENRMWKAICGHLPDLTRVHPSEWVLLSCIAASRQEGILQGDLVRASGQDKRSVPKRTDALHEKGYIFKQTIYLKGNKSSRLCLRRFAEIQDSVDNIEAPISDQLKLRDVARQLFDVLKNNPLVAQEDLGDVLGMTSPGRARVLSQLIRHFGKTGCLKRVKTAFGPSVRSKDLKICVQYLKEPVADDWTGQAEQGIDLDASVETLASFYEATAGQSHPEIDQQDVVVEFTEPSDSVVVEGGLVGALRSVLPQWNPDRILANVLFEAAHEAGSQGLTNSSARNMLTGPFIKRTLESLLVKISNRTLQAQPQGLKHLAIPRTQEFRNGLLQYIHYSFEGFSKKVERGEANWKDVSGGDQFVRDLAEKATDDPSVAQTLPVDSFGFPLRIPPRSQSKNGASTMSQLIHGAKIKEIGPKTGEPFLREVSPGHFEIGLQDMAGPPSHSDDHHRRDELAREQAAGQEQRRINAPKRTTNSAKKILRVSKHVDENGKPIKGRPRKFTQGTERYWRDVLGFIVREKAPQYFQKHGKVGVTNDPGALKVFNQRPKDFDETIKRAMELGLPVASEKRYISQEWVDKINAIIHRTDPGLYITPPGYQLGSRRARSQFLILRSSRLGELDLVVRPTCWPWQQISSSASHSLRYQRNYPQLETTPCHVTEASQLMNEPSTPDTEKSEGLNCPPRGVFYEVMHPPQDEPLAIASSSIDPAPRSVEHCVSGDSTDATDSDSNVRKKTPVSIITKSHPTASGTTVAPNNLSNTHNEEHLLPNSPITTSKSVAPTRSHRRRQLTRKAAENLQAPDSKPVKKPSAPPLTSADSLVPNIVQSAEPVSNTLPLNSCKQGAQAETDEENRISANTNNSPGQIIEVNEVPSATGPNSNSTKQTIEDGHQGIQETPTSKRETLPISHIDNSGLIQQAETSIINQRETPPPELLVISTPEPGSINAVSVDHTQTADSDTNLPSTGKLVEDLQNHETSEPITSSTTPISRKQSKNVSVNLHSDKRQQDDGAVAHKRAKKDGLYEATRPQVSKLCRVLVLELVGLCSGIAPNVPWTLRRAMVPRWQEAGVTGDQLSAKNVRAGIKALCESGKLKQITFAFKGKSNLMVKMSVLTLRGVDALSPAVLELQRKMIEMEPADYVPAELELEGQRPPNELNKKRYSKEIGRNDFEEEVNEQPSTSKASNTLHRRARGNPFRHDREAVWKEPQQSSDADEDQTTLSSPSQKPKGALSLNIGFLTLQVTRLKELDIPIERRSRHDNLTAEPLRSAINGTSVHPEQPTVADRNAKPAGRRTITRKKTSRSILTTPKLIWKKAKKVQWPSGLDDIPNMKLSREDIGLNSSNGARSARFEAEVDCVAAWEVKTASILIEVQCENLVLINHTFDAEVSDRFPDFPALEFRSIVTYAEDTGDEIELSFPDSESWPPFVAALDQRRNGSLSSTRGHRSRKSTKRKADPDVALNERDHEHGPSTKRQRESHRSKRPRRSLRTAVDIEDSDVAPRLQYKRNRLTQLLRYMTEEEKYQVVVAVVVVRTLAGGIEKFIDWRLVCRLLPTQEEHILRDAWRTISNRYRSDVSDITDSLQHRYIEALNLGQVPSINFVSTHDTDWEGIFKWALSNLDKSLVKQAEDLPSNRAHLLSDGDYVFQEFKGLREILGYNITQSVPRKEEAMSGVVFGKALQNRLMKSASLYLKIPTEEEEADVELVRTKSWVMATMLTPEQTFDPAKAQAKLLTLAPTAQEVEVLLDKAVKCLQRDKLLSKSHRITGIGKELGSGPSDEHFMHLKLYEASHRFFEQLDFRRMVTKSMLKRAAKYKLEVLDVAFAQNLPVSLAKDTILDDGEMVAILNLLALGMIRVRPGNDVPASRWGLNWQKHGYTTRMIDKKSLGFTIILSAVKNNYITGDPLATTRNAADAMIPRGEIDRQDQQGTIPLWFDITHTFQPGMWELVLAAILGLVSTRPGIGVRELARTLCYGVSAREVEMVLNWAEKLELVRRTDGGADRGSSQSLSQRDRHRHHHAEEGGWESHDWWWMGVGTGGGWRFETGTENE